MSVTPSGLVTRKADWKTLKFVYKPTIRHYRRRLVDNNPRLNVDYLRKKSAQDTGTRKNHRSIQNSIVNLSSNTNITNMDLDNPRKISARLNRKSKIHGGDWSVSNKENSRTSSMNLVDMIDSSLGVVGPVTHDDLNGFADEYERQSTARNIATNNKKRCGIFLCLFIVSLAVIIPILTATLYQFITCYQQMREDSKLAYSNDGFSLNSTLVIARNNIEFGEVSNVTRILGSKNYDPFFQTRQLSRGQSENQNNTSVWTDDRLCLTNYILLFLAFFIVIIILVFVVGYSFS